MRKSTEDPPIIIHDTENCPMMMTDWIVHYLGHILIDHDYVVQTVEQVPVAGQLDGFAPV